MFCFPKSRINENGGNIPYLITIKRGGNVLYPESKGSSLDPTANSGRIYPLTWAISVCEGPKGIVFQQFWS